MKSLAVDIYHSARQMPVWVQIWVFFILIPTNMAGLFLWTDPVAKWIGILGVAGMIPNALFMVTDRGFTHKMALPHIIPWTILVVWLIYLLSTDAIMSTEAWYLACVVIIVNCISLVFDYRDCWRWFKAKQTGISFD